MNVALVLLRNWLLEVTETRIWRLGRCTLKSSKGLWWLWLRWLLKLRLLREAKWRFLSHLLSRHCSRLVKLRRLELWLLELRLRRLLEWLLLHRLESTVKVLVRLSLLLHSLHLLHLHHALHLVHWTHIALHHIVLLLLHHPWCSSHTAKCCSYFVNWLSLWLLLHWLWVVHAHHLLKHISLRVRGLTRLFGLCCLLKGSKTHVLTRLLFLLACILKVSPGLIRYRLLIAATEINQIVKVSRVLPLLS